MRILLTSLVLLPFGLFAQTLKGKVVDNKTQEPVIGASVIPDGKGGAVSDINGNYSLKLSPGQHRITCSFIGYRTDTVNIQADSNAVTEITFQLKEEVKSLGTVVISAGKFEQNIEDVTVSMEVIKPQLIENKNATDMESVIDQVPGVNVMDGQVQIRGGSGFSYGAGSRVLLLVDDLPMLTCDAGDIKWDYLPIENIEQVEVIKGASSALFGSSALNGVINVRTAYPKDVPQTCINLSSGIYDNPRRHELKWWGNTNPTFTNCTFFHSRQIRNLDLVVGGNVFSDDGFRKLETTQRVRFNYNLRYRFKKVKGLSVGLNGNHMAVAGGLFILWAGADSAYLPQGGNLQLYTNYRTNLDPFLSYFGKKGGRHTVHTRFFRSNNTNDKDQESKADLYYAEYQYQKHFDKELTLTTGAVFTYGSVHSDSLYGRHFSNNASVYAQLDKKFKKLILSFGARGEYFKVDTVQTEFKIGKSTSPVYPVFRLGANYPLAKYTHVRASFGQGYRFPAVAEKYITTQVSGLTILPNPNLKPENGWSAEVGIKQGVKLGGWKGFADLAAFWTEYQDMIEFNFDYYVPKPDSTYSLFDLLSYFGAKSLNIGHTRITGVEPTLSGTGMLGPIEMSIMAGYTYINPINLNSDRKYIQTGTDTVSGILKYRFKHTAKADIELKYKKVMVGWSMRYNSYMQNIDRRFEEPLLYDLLPTYQIYILPGLKEYRAEHHHGDLVCDARLAVQASKLAKVSFICNNVFNLEYAARPGYVMAPRNFAIQVVCRF